ncbi:hypothetical protein G7046_g5310 [Stylonectria norvegica]|nr:hypothetical protein G7046_g5310 [Stylonectria norvegica]
MSDTSARAVCDEHASTESTTSDAVDDLPISSIDFDPPKLLTLYIRQELARQCNARLKLAAELGKPLSSLYFDVNDCAVAWDRAGSHSYSAKEAEWKIKLADTKLEATEAKLQAANAILEAAQMKEAAAEAKLKLADDKMNAADERIKDADLLMKAADEKAKDVDSKEKTVDGMMDRAQALIDKWESKMTNIGPQMTLLPK